MEEYNNQDDYQYEYDDYQQPQKDKSIKGLKIMIVILALVLGALSYMYYSQVRQMRMEYAEERDILTGKLTDLIGEYDNLQVENDTINSHLEVERHRVDSLLQSLQKERNLNRQVVRQYEQRIADMTSYITTIMHQVDSLNNLNQRLSTENISYRSQIRTAQMRAEIAEEKASELEIVNRKGSVIRARDIRMEPLSSNDRVVTRANRAARLRVDMVLVGNELATPGERTIYVRIKGPDGYILGNSANATFNFEGDMLTYSAMRPNVDYQNEDLPISIYYNGSGIVSGTYAVEIYVDGLMIGSTELTMR